MDLGKQFEEIRRDRIGVVNSSVYPGLKTLVSEIYPEEAHFIYELLQNAEDAGASSVVFEIKSTELVFKHNGEKQFDADDVNSITNIAHSTKRENYVQAGKFGIGFKSVYAFTETPSIYCDTINFKIEKLLLPTIIEPLTSREAGWTEFHFPFDSPKITPGDAKGKIKQGLLEIENTTLLFLNNIHRIDYILENGQRSSVCKAVKNGMVISAIYDNHDRQVSRSIWKRMTRDTELNGKKVAVDIAFPMEYIQKDKTFKFLLGEDKVCITFYARNEKSNLHFYVNAPFGCTPSRDSINKQDVDNRKLVHELAVLVAESLQKLKAEGMLTDEFFNILPLDDDEISEFYYPIVDVLRGAFITGQYLPTVSGGYISVKDGIMSSRNVIDKILSIEDVRTIYNCPRMQFVKNRPVNSRAYKFLKSLDIEELTPEGLLIKMISLKSSDIQKWIKNRSNTSLSDLYDFLYKGVLNLSAEMEKYKEYAHYYRDIWYRNNLNYQEESANGKLYFELSTQFEKIKALPIIKNQKGDFSAAKDLYIVTEKIEVPEEYLLVDQAVVKTETTKKLLDLLGIHKFSREELNKYLYSQEIYTFVDEINTISVDENPLEVVDLVLNFFNNHKYSEVDLKNVKFIWTDINSDKDSILEIPGNCFLDAPLYEETGFRFAQKVHRKKGLSPVYQQLSDEKKHKWCEVLKYYGVFCSFAIEKISFSTGYVTGYDIDYKIPKLEEFLKLRRIEINLYLWKYMTANWSSHRYKYHSWKINRNYITHEEDSSIVSILKQTAWIPDKEGNLKSPEDISRMDIDSRFVIDEKNGFLEDIDFEKKVKIEADRLEKQREKERLEQEKESEAAKMLGFANAEEVMSAKDDSRVLRELEELGIDARQLLAFKQKERKERQAQTVDEQLNNLRQNEFKKGNYDTDDDISPVKNVERRKSKLTEKLEDEKQQESKTVVTRKETIHPEEKKFVEVEYSAQCQVCSKIIYKKDGSRHFVARNLLDTAVLADEYKNGITTGWNTLCLCPNCAAEFKYGSVSLYDFKQKVLQTDITPDSDDYISFEIEMQGEQRKLRYTPRHLLVLKTAFEFFDTQSQQYKDTIVSQPEKIDIQNESKKEKFSFEKTYWDVDASEISNLNTMATTIKVVKRGDACPDCGRKNTVSSMITVIDRQGLKKCVKAISCVCGCIYMTKKLKSLIAGTESNYLLEEIAVPKSEIQQPVKKKKRKIITVKQRRTVYPKTSIDANDLGKKRCRKCGAYGTFYGTDLCWDCYKEAKSTLFG